MALKRLDKLIALNCNVSRKEARALIKDGAVKLNGVFVLRAEELIDTAKDDIDVKGYNFTLRDHIYIMMNKPAGVITATEDKHKQTVLDLVPPDLKRRSLFPCGRLDRDTTGLLILTDDGELCHKILSPSHKVFKTYIARLEKPLSDGDIEVLEKGILLADGTQCLPAKVKYFTDDGFNCAEIKIREGKYHQVKRMFAATGNYVEALKRVRTGALELDPDLAEGECRELTGEEIKLLFEDDD